MESIKQELTRKRPATVVNSRGQEVTAPRLGVVVNARVVPRPAVRVKPKRPTVAGEIGKALAFVATIAAAALATLVGLIAFISSHVTAAALAQLGGLAVVAILAGAVLLNRGNHSGACPGIAVHCKGCKH